MGSRAEDLRFRHDLAEAVGERLADQIVERLPMVPVQNLATKDDVAELRGEFAELRGEFHEMRGAFGELRGAFGEFRGEVRAEISGLRTEMQRTANSMIKWVVGIVLPALVTGIGASAAITAAIVR